MTFKQRSDTQGHGSLGEKGGGRFPAKRADRARPRAVTGVAVSGIERRVPRGHMLVGAEQTKLSR